MGAKRKHVDSPAKAGSKKAKAAAVVPAQDAALGRLLSALDGDLGAQLPATVVAMVKGIAKHCLLSDAEKRTALEAAFAGAVGTAVGAAVRRMEVRCENAFGTVIAAEKAALHLTAALAAADAATAEADDAARAAEDARVLAVDARAAAVEALKAQRSAEVQLMKEKERLDCEKLGMTTALNVVRGPAGPTKKEQSQVTKALRACGAAEALVLGCSAAVGRSGLVEQTFLAEACRLLDGRGAELARSLAEAAEAEQREAGKTATLQAEAAQAAAKLEACVARCKETKQRREEYAAAAEAARGSVEAGAAAVAAAADLKATAEAAVLAAKESEQTYTFLLKRSERRDLAVSVRKATTAVAAAKKALRDGDVLMLE